MIPEEFSLAAMVAFEHILLGLLVCVKAFIPDIPMKLMKKKIC